MEKTENIHVPKTPTRVTNRYSSDLKIVRKNERISSENCLLCRVVMRIPKPNTCIEKRKRKKKTIFRNPLHSLYWLILSVQPSTGTGKCSQEWSSVVTTFGKIVRILMSRNISTCTQPRRSKEFNRSTHGASARHLTPTSVMFAFPKRENHCSTGQFRP